MGWLDVFFLPVMGYIWNVDIYLLEGVESHLHALSSFLLTDLWGPVDFLKDKLDRLTVAVSSVDDVALLIHNDGGSRWARGLQLQL